MQARERQLSLGLHTSAPDHPEAGGASVGANTKIVDNPARKKAVTVVRQAEKALAAARQDLAIMLADPAYLQALRPGHCPGRDGIEPHLAPSGWRRPGAAVIAIRPWQRARLRGAER